MDVVLCYCRSYVELFKVNYRCPLDQAVQVAVQMRSKNVQVERIDVALQSVTDLLDPETTQGIKRKRNSDVLSGLLKSYMSHEL